MSEKTSGEISIRQLISYIKTTLELKYSKPSTGIPASDLASDVVTSLGKADTALQSAPVTSVNTKTGTVTLDANDVGAVGADAYATDMAQVSAVLSQKLNTFDLTIELDDSVGAFNNILTLSGPSTVTSVDTFISIAMSLNSARQVQFLIVLARDEEGHATSFIKVYPTMFDYGNRLLTLVGIYDGNRYTAELTAASASSTMTGTLVVESLAELPAVTASDNGKFLRVVSGAWAAQAVPSAESNSFGGGS